MSADGFTEATMSWTTDMSLVPKKVSGATRVGQRIARRLRTPRGACIGYPNDGLDISDMLQGTHTQADLANWQLSIRAEVLKDVAVSDAIVSVSASGGLLTISVNAFGEFGAATVTFKELADGTLSTVIS